MKRLFTFVGILLAAMITESAYSQVVIMPTHYYSMNKKVMYINHSTFIDAYNETRDLQTLSRRFDLLTAILVDPTFREIVFEYNPKVKEDYDKFNEKIQTDGLHRYAVTTEAEDMESLIFKNKYRNQLLKDIFAEDSKFVRIVRAHYHLDRAVITISANLTGSTRHYLLEKSGVELRVTRLSQEEINLDIDANALISDDNYRLGIRTGINISSVMESSGPSGDRSVYSTNGKVGANFGLVYSIPLDKYNFCYFEPGLFYNRLGGKDDVLDFTLDYLTIPFIFGIRESMGKGNSYNANYGFYLSKGIGGSVKYNDPASGNYTVDAFADNSNSLKFNDFTAGLILGIGCTIKKVYIGVNYNIGMGNLAKGSLISDAAEAYKLSNQWFSVNIGVNFGRKKDK